MEMRSSSEESQFIAFIARSLLPLKSMNELEAHVELPTTTNRPSLSGVPVLKVPAAPRGSGPFLFLGSCGLNEGELRSSVARLLSDDVKSCSTAVLSIFLVCMDRASGKPVATPFKPLTMGGKLYLLTRA